MTRNRRLTSEGGTTNVGRRRPWRIPGSRIRNRSTAGPRCRRERTPRARISRRGLDAGGRDGEARSAHERTSAWDRNVRTDGGPEHRPNGAERDHRMPASEVDRHHESRRRGPGRAPLAQVISGSSEGGSALFGVTELEQAAQPTCTKPYFATFPRPCWSGRVSAPSEAVAVAGPCQVTPMNPAEVPSMTGAVRGSRIVAPRPLDSRNDSSSSRNLKRWSGKRLTPRCGDTHSARRFVRPSDTGVQPTRRGDEPIMWSIG